MRNDILEELKNAADEMGTTQVGLVKLCVVSFLRWAKENNVRNLPDNWAKMIEEMDGRKTRYQTTESAFPVSESKPEYGNGKKRKGGGKAK